MNDNSVVLQGKRTIQTHGTFKIIYRYNKISHKFDLASSLFQPILLILSHSIYKYLDYDFFKSVMFW
jgi:hypothetical protein